jgi:hypothetical protein
MRQRVILTPVSHPVRHSSAWRAGFLLLLISLLFFSHSLHVVAEDSAVDNPQTMTWPMLPGESLNQLAALFYPNNKSMQQVFIKQTLALSQELHPELTANKAVNQLTSIIIPDLKALAKENRPKPKPTALKMTQQMGERSIAIVTEAMWLEYETLKQSNLLLMQELEKLHARLDKLQASAAKVKEVAQNFINKQTAQSAKPVEEKKPLSEPATTTAKTNKQPPIQVAQVGTPLPANNMQSRIMDFDWPLSTTGTLLAIGLFGLVLAFLYGLNKRRYKHIDGDLASQEIKPIDWPPTEINPPSQNMEETLPYVALIHPDTLFSSSESLEQARILSGSGRPKAAIELLEAVIATEADKSLEAWLYLLDLYREMGLKTEFIEYAQRLHTSFNVMTPQWEIKEVALVTANSLEEFPHIIEELSQHWKDGSAQDYLTGLLKDNREGERAGFSIPVLQEIMLLQAILKTRDY